MKELVLLKLVITDPLAPAIGVVGIFDHRLSNPEDRERAQFLVEDASRRIASQVRMWNHDPVKVVYSTELVQSPETADKVARAFKEAGVNILVFVCDTWSFPELTLMAFRRHFPDTTPMNVTCGNSGPKPGVVFVQACSGMCAQTGIQITTNIGSWPDTGTEPLMTQETSESLIDWCFAAVTYQSWRGRRIREFGQDSMGMETARAHIDAMRRIFGLEVIRDDMLLVAGLLDAEAYDQDELKELDTWFDAMISGCLGPFTETNGEEKWLEELAMYLVVRDLLEEVNAIGGGFASQLTWGSDTRLDRPRACADAMESLFNSTFDHTGPKSPLPFGTEKDTQGTITMMALQGLSGGSPPLFMDFRKVWPMKEVRALIEEQELDVPKNKMPEGWFYDGDNSGSASFNWAAHPGASIEGCMANVSMPPVDPDYFPGGGFSVNFTTPGGIDMIDGRMAFHAPTDKFSLLWSEAVSVYLPENLAKAVAETSTSTWPHTFIRKTGVTPEQAGAYAAANHTHAVWNLSPRRVEYWCDLTGVRNVFSSVWPEIQEGHRPVPLERLLDGSLPTA